MRQEGRLIIEYPSHVEKCLPAMLYFTMLHILKMIWFWKFNFKAQAQPLNFKMDNCQNSHIWSFKFVQLLQAPIEIEWLEFPNVQNIELERKIIFSSFFTVQFLIYYVLHRWDSWCVSAHEENANSSKRRSVREEKVSDSSVSNLNSFPSQTWSQVFYKALASRI